MAAAGSRANTAPLPVEISDDRSDLQPGDKVLLVVEDDPTFARILSDLAHERGMKVLIALRGDRALRLAQEHQPAGITLDIRLPDMAGWTILDRLRNDPRTRHIPVHVISIDEDRRRGLSLGASTYLEKSIDKQALVDVLDRIRNLMEHNERNLLIAEADEENRERLKHLIEAPDVQTTFVTAGEAALNAIRVQRFDCVVTDLDLADMNAFEFVDRLQKEPGGRELPVIIYSGAPLDAGGERELRRVAASSLVRSVSSAETLLEETALFLHRVEANLSDRSVRFWSRRGKAGSRGSPGGRC